MNSQKPQLIIEINKQKEINKTIKLTKKERL